MIALLKHSFKCKWFEIQVLFFRETENALEIRHQKNVSNFDEVIRKRKQDYRCMYTLIGTNKIRGLLNTLYAPPSTN